MSLQSANFVFLNICPCKKAILHSLACLLRPSSVPLFFCAPRGTTRHPTFQCNCIGSSMMAHATQQLEHKHNCYTHPRRLKVTNTKSIISFGFLLLFTGLYSFVLYLGGSGGKCIVVGSTCGSNLILHHAN
jgi:hypothetical protein